MHELVNLKIEIKLNLKFGRYNTSVKTRNFEVYMLPEYLAINFFPLECLQ